MTRYGNWLKIFMVGVIAAAIFTAAFATDPEQPQKARGSEQPQKVKDGAAFFASQADLRALEKQAKILEMKVQEAQRELERAEIQVKAGTASASELPPLRVKVEEAGAQLAKAQQGLIVARRLQALSQPIEIEMNNVRIQQAADLLSKISSMGITVDGSVPRTLTVSTTARNVPLGTALELIANSANLSITVNEKGGITFVSPGKVMVNGKTVDYRGPAWPWSDDVLVLGVGDYGPVGRRWMMLGDSPWFQEFTGSSDSPFGGNLGGYMPATGQATVTALGSTMLVVAEPGKGPKGEPGLWLTLYTIKNGQFKQTSRYFHKGPQGSTPKQITIDLKRVEEIKKKVETKTAPPKK